MFMRGQLILRFRNSSKSAEIADEGSLFSYRAEGPLSLRTGSGSSLACLVGFSRLVQTKPSPLPEALGPASRLWRRYADAPTGALLTGSRDFALVFAAFHARLI